MQCAEDRAGQRSCGSKYKEEQSTYDPTHDIAVRHRGNESDQRKHCCRSAYKISYDRPDQRPCLGVLHILIQDRVLISAVLTYRYRIRDVLRRLIAGLVDIPHTVIGLGVAVIRPAA